MNNESKSKEAIEGFNQFLSNFKNKDEFTKIFLEIILENLIKNEKKS